MVRPERASQRRLTPARVAVCREAGHTTPAMGCLKKEPNDRCCTEAGHATPMMGWLNFSPNDSRCRKAGHSASTTGWLKQFPKDSRFRDGMVEALPER